MSIPVSQIVNTQSFGTWLIRTNQMAQLFSQNTVTIDGSLTGSVSSGNSAVNGYFSATFLSANTIQGGSVGNTSNLAISTNTNFQVNGANVLSTFGNSTSTTVLINSNNFVVNNGTTIIGNVVFANTLSVNGNIYSNTNISVGNTFNANTTSVNFGSNLSANTSTLFVGNSTIFTNINSTSHNITNPTSNIQINPMTFSMSFANTSSSLSLNTSSLSVGNSTANVILNTNNLLINNPVGFISVGNNAKLTNNTLTVSNGLITTSLNPSAVTTGNSTIYSVINSVSMEVSSPTSNSTLFANYLLIGNSTVNSTVNATTFTGISLTSNNSLYLGGIIANGYQTVSGLPSNVATLTSNNSLYFNGQLSSYYANSTSPNFSSSVNVGSSVGINSTSYSVGNSILTGNSLTTNTVSAANIFITGNGVIAGTLFISGNLVYTGTTVANGSYIPASDNIFNVGNSTNRFIGYFSSLSSNTLISNTLTIGNSTSNSTVNSTIFSGTSNNTNYVGGVAAANIVTQTNLTSYLGAYQTTAGLAANVTSVLLGTSALSLGATGSYIGFNTNYSSGFKNIANGYSLYIRNDGTDLSFNYGSNVNANSTGSYAQSFNISYIDGSLNLSSPLNAANVSGTFANFSNVISTNSGFITSGYDTGGGNLRIIQGGYGVVFRNDANNFYLLSTSNGSANGSWNNYRPIQLSLTTGILTLDATNQGVVIGSTAGTSNALSVSSNSGSAIVGSSYNNYSGYFQSITGVGLYSQSNTNWAIQGVAMQGGIGVYGSSNTGGGGYFVSSTGTGVQGFAYTTGFGVYGSSNNGTGIAGVSNTGIGVYGSSNTSNGVYGTSNSGYGLYGLSNTSYGLYAISKTGNIAAFSNNTVINAYIDNFGNFYTNANIFVNTSISFYGGNISGANYTGTANNANFLGTIPASSYSTLGGLSANVATLTSNNTNYVGSTPAANIVSQASLNSSLGSYATLAGLSANVATLTSNNTNYVGGVASANIVNITTLNANLANYQTISGLSSNVINLTANNSTNFNGHPSSYYANATSYTGTFNGTTITASGNVNLSGQINSSSAATFSGFDNGGSGGQIRLVSGTSYGFIERNDGAYFYHLITSNNAPYGTWNSFRPYVVNLSNGSILLDGTGAGTTVGSLGANNGGTALNVFAGINGEIGLNVQALTGNPIQIGNNSNIFAGMNNLGSMYFYNNMFVGNTSLSYNTLTSYSGSGAGVYGVSVSGYGGFFQANTGIGVHAESTYGNIIEFRNGVGVTGYIDNSGTFHSSSPIFINTSSLNSITGSATTAAGVSGTSGSGYGIYGYANTGIGVHAESTYGTIIEFRNGVGVTGYIDNSGTFHSSSPIFINTSSLNSITGSATTATGVYGSSGSGYGLYGYATSGIGVQAISVSSYPCVFANNTTTLAYVDNTGNFTAAGNITAYSDERLKDNIETIQNAVDTVKKIRGVTFTKNNKKGLGVIAQEIRKVIPEVVEESDMEGNLLSVAYGNLVGLLIEAIKEQQEQIDILKEKIK